MRGFFPIEILLVIFLLPYLFYVMESEPVPVLRETEVYAQDVAQMLMYGHSPQELPAGSFAIWVDGEEFHKCPYRFRYCTNRVFGGGEHRICVAECLP